MILLNTNTVAYCMQNYKPNSLAPMVHLMLASEPISGRVDRASATEEVDWGSIPGRVKPKTIKFGIHSFPA